MMRDAAALAAAIDAGIVRFDPSTTCSRDGCDAPLLAPAVFNPRSRLDGRQICDACDAWEFAHGTKGGAR